MIVVNYCEFYTYFKRYLDNVEWNNETLILKLESGKGFLSMIILTNIIKLNMLSIMFKIERMIN